MKPKLLKTLIIVSTSISLVFLLWSRWPSEPQLCRDLESYLPKTDCLSLENRFVILERAFPIGIATSDQVRGALGEYLVDENSRPIGGHTEVYHLSVALIDYLFGNFDQYRFSYDENGTLVRLA